jgi:hypothetical protein
MAKMLGVKDATRFKAKKYISLPPLLSQSFIKLIREVGG